MIVIVMRVMISIGLRSLEVIIYRCRFFWFGRWIFNLKMLFWVRMVIVSMKSNMIMSCIN